MKNGNNIIIRFFAFVFNRLLVIGGAVLLTLAFFLVLPLMQTLAKPPSPDLIIQTVDTAKLDAPEPPAEMEPEEEPEPEEKPPELTEQAPLLDITQLEIALNPGVGGGLGSGDFTVKLNTVVAGSTSAEELFSMSDLDQKPRILYQPSPNITSEMKKRLPGKVTVIFIVDKSGRVETAKILKSTDPVFDKETLKTIKKYKFEPGKRNGKPVKIRMKIPISYPKG